MIGERRWALGRETMKYTPEALYEAIAAHQKETEQGAAPIHTTAAPHH